MAKSLKELAASRQAWIDVSRENRFEEGIKKLLTELYPDNAHFIYELLQNAEDAGAKTVRFKLAEDHLVFEHDGERLFSLADVESITNIGSSTKSDDKTAIGKFGVGFKAVFAYTNSPEIHSGEFHFRLHDLVVPTTDGVEQKSLGPGVTRFIFPFDHPSKLPDKAVSEIEGGLQCLEDNTLLFLNNICNIEYTLLNCKERSIERIDHGDGHIEILYYEYADENVYSSHWLRFQKEVLVINEDGKETNCRISIAYSLQQQELKNQQSGWTISPLKCGMVFIYFPAEKETSNLLFHLHAPFASTVARDSVRDCDANNALRDELAKLVVESLSFIRDKGMLNVAFLAVLPNPSDHLSPFYEPIREAIVTAFQEQSLTPTKIGSHAPAAELYRGPAKITEVITNKDLALLSEYSKARWAANPPQLHQREDRFLDSLEIYKWGWEDLTDIFHDIDGERKDDIEKWIREKSDLELMRLYALLGEAHDSYYKTITIDDIHIVRVSNEYGDDHVLPEDAFFPPQQNVVSRSVKWVRKNVIGISSYDTPDDVNLVKIEVYAKGRSDPQKKYAQSFLEYIGVQLFDQKVIIKKKLESYNFSQKEGDWHFSDIKQFIKYWKDTGDIDIFKYCNYCFILGVSQNGATCWCKCDELYIDDPYFHTGLGNHCLYIISKKYKEKLSKSQLNDFIDFCIKLGVKASLEVVKVSVFDNPQKNILTQDYLTQDYYRLTKMTHTSIDNDYSIKNLQQYINSHSQSASLLLWNALIRANKDVALASFRPNRSYPTRTAESQLVYHLRTSAWIPDKSGNFRKPEDMTREELPDEFIYDDSNGLLTAIGFGKRAIEQDADHQRKNNNAQELGFESVEEAEQFKEICQIWKQRGQSPALVLQELKREPNFPERPVSDSARREARFAEQFADAPDKTSETRQRTVRTSKSAIDPTTWLQHNYTNDDDQMICQICKQEMPFKKRDGAPYFESREIFVEKKGKKGKKRLTKEHEAQYLALCPLCAAKYKEFIQGDEQAMDTLQAAILAADGLEIPVTLGEEQTTIRFVETHLHDFRTILKTEK